MCLCNVFVSDFAADNQNTEQNSLYSILSLASKGGHALMCCLISVQSLKQSLKESQQKQKSTELNKL